MGKELQRELQKLRKLRSHTPIILNRALTTLLAEMVERIHTNGKDSNGSNIGQYSTKPISISQKSQARRTGKSYFQGGYKEYKRAIGFPSFVNLENTGQQRQDTSVIRISRNKAGIGFKNKKNFDKSNWQEEKYRKNIYQPTKKEKEVVLNVINSELSKLLK